MSTTFTKFDQLGAVLAELSFRSVSLHLHRGAERAHSAVYLHDEAGCTQGIGGTPSEALQDALAQMARKEAEHKAQVIEAAAAQVAA